MKNVILIVITLCNISLASFAQSNVAAFQVNQTQYLAFDNFNSNTNLELYSQESGGQLLGIHSLNVSNAVVINTLLPKMILNRKSGSNVNGNNQVFDVQEKEFIVENITISKFDNHSIIAWEANTYNNNIQFKILKSTNGGNYLELETVNANQDNFVNKYKIIDANAKNVEYKIQIVKDNYFVRYISEVLLTGSVDGIANVYPTKSNAMISIDVTKLNIQYAIIDYLGRKMASNSLATFHNCIDISTYKNGIYFIHVFDNNKQQIFKILKD
jgi:Secretion system C-terminal sorting domain